MSSNESDKVENSGEKNEKGKMEIAGNEVDINGRQDLTNYFQTWDHSVNNIHKSKVPQICKDEPCCLGVDEAGRGPVLGPMVYGISYIPLSKTDLLKDLGCADSKSLTEEKRDAIFDKICGESDSMGYAVDVISPNFISNSMHRRAKSSLNEVSMNSAINLIKIAIEDGAFIREIYVDTVGPPEKYQVKLQSIFPGLKIVVAKKADSTYPIVSAASICAKVSRDHALRAWQFREGELNMEIGSGYPNDPATKKWLASNVDNVFGFPQIVRFSWSTSETILKSNALAVEWEDREEELQFPKEVKISKYFMKAPTKSRVHKKKHAFFIDRCLNNATEL